MTEITGTLRMARRVTPQEDISGPCLSGYIYGDSKGRFRDGSTIVTSTIMSEEGDIFRTRFSTYRVESWADAAPSPSFEERLALLETRVNVAETSLSVSMSNISRLVTVVDRIVERIIKAAG